MYTMHVSMSIASGLVVGLRELCGLAFPSMHCSLNVEVLLTLLKQCVCMCTLHVCIFFFRMPSYSQDNQYMTLVFGWNRPSKPGSHNLGTAVDDRHPA